MKRILLLLASSALSHGALAQAVQAPAITQLSANPAGARSALGLTPPATASFGTTTGTVADGGAMTVIGAAAAAAQATANAAIPLSQRAAANGVATLGASTTVPLAQIPTIPTSQVSGLSPPATASFGTTTGTVADGGAMTAIGTVAAAAQATANAALPAVNPVATGALQVDGVTQRQASGNFSVSLTNPTGLFLIKSSTGTNLISIGNQGQFINPLVQIQTSAANIVLNRSTAVSGVFAPLTQSQVYSQPPTWTGTLTGAAGMEARFFVNTFNLNGGSDTAPIEGLSDTCYTGALFRGNIYCHDIATSIINTPLVTAEYHGLRSTVFIGATGQPVGGTSGSPLGVGVGIKAASVINNTNNFFNWAMALEVVGSNADPTTQNSYAAMVTTTNTANTLGDNAMLALWAHGGTVGAKNVIQFGTSLGHGELPPCIAGVACTLIGTAGPSFTADHGVNWSNVTFTTDQWLTPGASIGPTGAATFAGLAVNGNVGFFGATPISKQTLTGACGGSTGCQAIAAYLATAGLVTNAITN